MTFIKPPPSIYYSYAIGRGETGVLTFEPYKSHLLPMWRFRTVPIARSSSAELYAKFLEFHKHEDFVGMDMARKFIQMGMTRAKRYANHKGGKKYGNDGEILERGQVTEAMIEKEEASKVFKDVWERCKEFEGYKELRAIWEAEKKEWIRMHKEEKTTKDEA